MLLQYYWKLPSIIYKQKQRNNTTKIDLFRPAELLPSESELKGDVTEKIGWTWIVNGYKKQYT